MVSYFAKNFNHIATPIAILSHLKLFFKRLVEIASYTNNHIHRFFHRFFIIGEGDQLKIVSMDIFKPQTVKVSSIKKIEVTKLGLTLIFSNDSKKRIFYMRKWPKKYFLDALAVHPNFQGEVELMDAFTELDYFEAYKDEKIPKGLKP